MGWVAAALLAVGLSVVSVTLVRVVRRLIALIVALDLEREMLTELACLFVGGDADAKADVEPEARFVDDVPEGRIECGIDVFDADGRVVGTVVIPAPASN